MKRRRFRHIFGPVVSRRLGRSLGVDPIPLKMCPYDCIYCQLGPTRKRTIKRASYIPVEKILEEIEARLEQDVEVDYITISGSGEPTLHSGLGDMIERISTITKIPVAVLTNGSLLHDPRVREAVSRAQLVIPSLDTCDQGWFECVNRPHPMIDFRRMVEGLINFRREWKGPLWLEVFLLGGLNARDEVVQQISRWADEIGPDIIHLNTVARPPARRYALKVPEEELLRLSGYFRQKTIVVQERRLDKAALKIQRQEKGGEELILATLKRRPCGLGELSTISGIPETELIDLLAGLERKGRIERYGQGGSAFFKIRMYRSGGPQ